MSNKNPKTRRELNERQKRFIDYYIQTGNVTDSARRAGYSDKAASVVGNEILRNPKVRAAIDSRLKDMESERTATTQEIQEYLTKVMRGEVEDEVVVNVGVGKGYTRAEKVQQKVGTKDRNKAAELLGKIRGMFVAKSEVELSGNVPVVIKDDLS